MTSATSEMLVTPDMAKEYLQSSGGNRKINKARVEGYVRDLQSGNWFVGDSIKFNEDGTLIDGHHRLSAVIWAGIPARFIVTTGLPKDSVNGINMAVPWRSEQISKIEGEQFSRSHFTIARILEFGTVNSAGGRFHLTYSEQKALVLKYESAINFAVKLNAGHQRFLNSVTLAVIARASYSRDRGRLEGFAEVMRTGEPVSVNNDSAAIRLRNFIISGMKQGHRTDRTELYKRCETAVWHFCKCNYIKSLKPAGQELFPLKLNAKGEVVAA